MPTVGEDRNLKLDSAVVFAALALLSALWFGLSFLVELPFKFGPDGYSAAVFPAVGFGLLAVFCGGFSWMDFPLEEDSREATLSRVAMLVGGAVVVVVLAGMLLPEIRNIDISSD
mgnify:FL=1